MSEDHKSNRLGCWGIIAIMFIIGYIVDRCEDSGGNLRSGEVEIKDITPTTRHWRIKDIDYHIDKYGDDRSSAIFNANKELKGTVILLSGIVGKISQDENDYWIEFDKVKVGGSLYTSALVEFSNPISNIRKDRWYTFAGRWDELKTIHTTSPLFGGVNWWTLYLRVNNAIQLETQY